MKDTPAVLRGDSRIVSFLLAAGTSLVVGAPAAVAAAESQAYTVRLTVGAAGFEPKRVSVPLGVVRFVVTSREGDHCFAIPALDVEKRVRTANPLEVDVAFERAGDFPFLCCVEPSATKETGVILVAPGK